MRKALGLMLSVLMLALFPMIAPAQAQSSYACPSLPFIFSNGTIADGTQVNANFSSVVSCINNAPFGGGGGGGSDTRTSLTAALDLYISPSGSDATGNNCTNNVAPCATMQNAYNQWQGIVDQMGVYGVHLHLAAGTYPNARLLCSGQQIGSQFGGTTPVYWQIVGAGSGSTTLAGTQFPAVIAAQNQCFLGIQGVTITNTVSSDVFPSYGGVISVNADVVMGAAGLGQMHAETGGVVKIVDNLTVVGNSTAFADAVLGGIIFFPEGPVVITFNGGTYSKATFNANENGWIYINKFYNTVTGPLIGTVTGYISGTTFTVVTDGTGGLLAPNQEITSGNPNVMVSNTSITVGSGGAGSYTVNNSQTVGSIGTPATFNVYQYVYQSGTGSTNGVRFVVDNGGGIETESDVGGAFLPGRLIGQVLGTGWYSRVSQTAIIGCTGSGNTCTGLGATGSATVQSASNERAGVLVLTTAGGGYANNGVLDMHFASELGQFTSVCTFTMDNSVTAGSPGTWAAAASVAADPGTTTQDFLAHWNNAGVTVTGGKQYLIMYICTPF